MALKGDRQPIEDSVVLNYFWDSNPAERGGIACVKTTGSGVALDQGVNVAYYHTSGSGGVPIGILQNDVVNKDATQMHLDFNKDEVLIGGKVTLYRQGWWGTNMVLGTPNFGATAYLGNSGYFNSARLNTAFPIVGRFETPKNEQGYATVFVNTTTVLS